MVLACYNFSVSACPMPEFKLDPQKHHRKSIRLKGYDYSQPGAYFLTLVVYQHDCLFGEIQDANMFLNDLGKIADECWRAIPDHFPFVELGAHVVMPNHVHGVIVIHENAGLAYGSRGAAMLRPYETRPNENRPNVKTGSWGAIVRSYKSAVSYHIHKQHNATGIWQRNFYEHIIRDEKDLQRITKYIEMNPLRWGKDEENLQNHA